MDFNSTGLQSILNESLQHRNVKLIMTVNKAEELINMISSTFGPDPHRKIVVDSYQGLLITSDTNKILSSIKLVHPIQFLLRDVLTKMSKYGDGSTFLVLLIGKLLNKCKELLNQGMPSYKIVESLKKMKKQIFTEIDRLKTKIDVDLSNSSVLNTILAPILKDQILIDLLTQAVIKSQFKNIDDIRIQKVQTGSFGDSFVINGIFLERIIESQIEEVSGESVIYNTSLDIDRSETKGTLLFEKAEDMLNFGKDEDFDIDLLTKSISENVKIVFFNGNVNERFVEFFNNRNVLVVRVISKFDLQRLMKMSGGKLLQQIRKPENEEIGKFDCIKTIYNGEKAFLQIENSNSNVVSIVLKDALSTNLNESEMLLQKGMKALNFLLKNEPFLIEGAGKLELTLSDKLESLAEELKCSSKLVYTEISRALREFGQTFSDSEELFDILQTKKNAYEAAFDVACEVLMIEDYLVGKNDGPVPGQ